ncbi:chemotaxis protein CheD [Candidatus Uhrbacteria bacterium]|nr:chemotaxis protein CheD [Candidatus Uhrbacteria bacterium]
MPEFVVNTGEIAVGRDDALIRTGSVGSCVVIVLYDGQAKVGGLAHALLPSRPKNDPKLPEETPAKFADEAVDRLIAEIEKIGGQKERLRSKLVGGAQMFKILGGDRHGIGYQNAESARNKLRSLAIPIDGEDIGGTVGRIVEFNVRNGLVETVTKM